MKRTASIATVFVAAVLIGGGGYSALATGGTDRHGGSPEDRPSVTASPAPAPSPSPASLTAAQAAAAARKAYPGTPGTVVEVELDGDLPGYWEVHIVGADHVRREVRVDSRTGAVTLDRRGGDDGPGDDHGVHAGGDDHLDVGDDHGGDRHAGDDGGRGRHRGGHGGDDH
ncbi:PepSY domain-containing protein [Streptomyces sp. DT193]|uniref:PepSY domain-containing protein n=1 Tax=Streptomyces sp. DT193 TaxID=3393418 RepID=UPI003CEC4E27